MTAVIGEVVINVSNLAKILGVAPEDVLGHVFGAMPTSPEELSSHIADYKVWLENGRPETLHGMVAFLKLAALHLCIRLYAFCF